MSIDLTSLLAGISLTAIAGWLGSILALRKDERSVQIDQVTKERKAWRDNMRALTHDIVIAYYENKTEPKPGRVAALRSKLTTSINPKDDKHDLQLLAHFDDLFSARKDDIEIFTKRMALLLKHDWERVKWECTPIYIKLFTRFTQKQRSWRSASYREVDG